jgi:hypothetical protein
MIFHQLDSEASVGLRCSPSTSYSPRCKKRSSWALHFALVITETTT